MDHIRDIKEEIRHVLIRGHLFTHTEKAPFVSSGESLLGALEYDLARDLVKCHECGAWKRGLGAHVLRVHGINRLDYAQKHGLRKCAALSSPTVRKQKSEGQDLDN
jgi:hypothetical protein